jgi:hypothetical protein
MARPWKGLWQIKLCGPVQRFMHQGFVIVAPSVRKQAGRQARKGHEEREEKIDFPA